MIDDESDEEDNDEDNSRAFVATFISPYLYDHENDHSEVVTRLWKPKKPQNVILDDGSDVDNNSIALVASRTAEKYGLG